MGNFPVSNVRLPALSISGIKSRWLHFRNKSWLENTLKKVLCGKTYVNVVSTFQNPNTFAWNVFLKIFPFQDILGFSYFHQIRGNNPGESIGLKFIPNQSEIFRYMYPSQCESFRTNPKNVLISFDEKRSKINPT